MNRIVIVGAGAAGWSAAVEARRLGFAGALTVLGDEPPYDRPACSKGILSGHQRPRDIGLRLPSGPLDVTVARPATGLDLHRRLVWTGDGDSYEFDGLVIATGTAPTVRPDWPTHEPGIHTLHSLTDAWAVRKALRSARKVVVIGGGVTGCEAACTAYDLGLDVVIVDAAPMLMRRAVGERIGALLTRSHQDRGIRTVLGHRVVGIERRPTRRASGHAWTVELDDGSWIGGDLVLVTGGERPDTGWLTGSGLDLTDGVNADAALRALAADGSGPVRGVVVAGAIARFAPTRGATPSRVGQWIAAMEQGRVAAATLLGTVPPPLSTTRWWTQQDALRVQVCGDVSGRAEVTGLRPGSSDPARTGVLGTFHRDGRLVGLVAVNAPAAFTAEGRGLLPIADPPVAIASSGRHAFAARQ
jgi:NADPH-dependent 2,4-dienoyl-CoA reductase/sulfur reductase-like enzyme